uniref:Uncharacterized protein n=1 Tax=Timema monikensis TaxID=170555 RepID=A0A7R9E1G7_9NEOP|nr:unnamed protein product [Timema monikensis]
MFLHKRNEISLCEQVGRTGRSFSHLNVCWLKAIKPLLCVVEKAIKGDSMTQLTISCANELGTNRVLGLTIFVPLDHKPHGRELTASVADDQVAQVLWEHSLEAQRLETKERRKSGRQKSGASQIQIGGESRCVSPQKNLTAKCMSTNKSDPEPDMAPVKFTTSKAATWKAVETRGGGEDDWPWFQSYVISLSVGIFLIYFCILREENDVDQDLSKSLYERISGLEEKQLFLVLDYNKEHGLPTDEIKARLIELGQIVD